LLLFVVDKTMIRGWQKTSFIDYPGKISTVLFFSGCNFRCGFCHNPDLVYNRPKLPKYSEQGVINYLIKRKKIIEAVVLSGGEPTLNKNLPKFLQKIKKLGFLVKLDTNGTNPKMLKRLIKEKLVDYLAMDLKGPLEKYSQITTRPFNPQLIKKSIKIIKTSGLPYEFRSTILPYFHKITDILKMAKLITGAEIYYLQKFVPRRDLVNKKIIKEEAFNHQEMTELAKKCQEFVKKCFIR